MNKSKLAQESTYASISDISVGVAIKADFYQM